MFACVYFQKDGTLSVVHENDKDLNILSSFDKKELVEMSWRIAPGKRKEIFQGIIVRVGDNQETLTKFATKAYNAMLKGVAPGTPVPEGLFDFEFREKKGGAKRERVQTKRLEESKEQNLQMSPKKRKHNEENKTNDSNEQTAVKKIAPKKNSTHVSKDDASKTVGKKKNIMDNDAPVKPVNIKKQQVIASEGAALETGKKIMSLFEQFNPSETPGHESLKNQTISPTCGLTEAHAENPKSVNSFKTPFGVLDSAEKIKSASSLTQDTHQKQTIDLTDTWNICSGALKFINGEPTHSQLSHVPVVSPAVMATLKGIFSPEFILFLQQLTEHMKCTTCQHTCFKMMNSSATHQDPDSVMQGDIVSNGGSFLSQLQDFDNDITNDVHVHMMTSTPKVTLAKEQLQTTNVMTLEGTQNVPGPSSRISLSFTHPTCQDSTEKETPECFPGSPLSHSHASSFSMESSEKTTPRRSPRKLPQSQVSPNEKTEMVKLLPNNSLKVQRKVLRKVCNTASKKKEKAGFYLMYGLLDQIFTLNELANSRGTGVGRARPGEEDKPVLDQEKLAVLREYVTTWVRKNLAVAIPESDLNMAVTERNSYARKQLKKIGQSNGH